MGFRQSLNEKPVAVACVAAVIVAASLFLTLRGCFSENDDAAPEGGEMTKSFFSTDDGKTFFVDDARRVPPYVVDKPGDANHGKTAWGARVARCGGGGEPFVWALEKYLEADQRKIESLSVPPRTYMSGARALLKKPGGGDKGWLRLEADAKQYAELARPKCADGSAAEVVNAGD